MGAPQSLLNQLHLSLLKQVQEDQNKPDILLPYFETYIASLLAKFEEMMSSRKQNFTASMETNNQQSPRLVWTLAQDVQTSVRRLQRLQ